MSDIVQNTECSVAITLGGSKELWITKDDRICLVTLNRGKLHIEIDLGPSTNSGFKRLKTCIERLEINATED